MPPNDHTLIGSVVERKSSGPSIAKSSKFTATPGTGFPVAQHRSKSAFARAREEAKANNDVARLDKAPLLALTKETRPPSTVETKPIPTDVEGLRCQISEENERVVANMSPEEVEKQRQEVLEQLGSGAEDLLKRVWEARQRKAAREEAARKSAGHTTGLSDFQPKPVLPSLGVRPGILRVKSLENVSHSGSSPVLVQRSSTRPPSRSGRKLRFAEVAPKDIHVYESAPTSPKQPVLALPPPPDKPDSSIISLGSLKGDPIPFKWSCCTDSPSDGGKGASGDTEPEEGTPEYIRRRYFPDAPENDPSLEWIQSSGSSDSSEPRFDLSGVIIPPSLSETLPSHLGLHHHAEGKRAGYTLDDIFLLSRSTVPAQRASMLSVLAKIAYRLGIQVKQEDSSEKVVELTGKEDELRKRILGAGLAAINERGSVGAMAVQVVWECLVGWDSDTTDLEAVELWTAPDVIRSTQPERLLPMIADILVQAVLPRETNEQLLAIIYRFAQESNELANVVTNSPNLIPIIIQSFLLTPIPPRGDSLFPNPLALRLLIILASASRANALALLDPADALLRFVALLPSSSPFPVPLATSLLTQTLRLYRVLACYGLYSHAATSASQYFSALCSYALAPPSMLLGSNTLIQLRVAWISLLEAWIVCATDPHITTPPHEILWSQVSAWRWASEVRQFRKDISDAEPDWEVWSAIWNTQAVWLEGSRINGVKGGHVEREEVLQFIKLGFESPDGSECKVVLTTLQALRRNLLKLTADGPGVEMDFRSIAVPAAVLCSAVRLWLACLPPLKDASLETPPFLLPFGELSKLCAELLGHPVWSLPQRRGLHLQIHLRPFTSLLAYFHRLSRYIPSTGPDLWLAQGFSILTRLIPGDEELALTMTEECALLITPRSTGLQAQLPSITTDILKPFFEHTIRPNSDVYISPLYLTTLSVPRATTLRLPGPVPLISTEDQVKTGLPLPRDWPTAPLTHLLRSGTSSVFRALPSSWDATEVDVVRATLLLLYVSHGVLQRWNLGMYALGPAESVFACMRVCMLEHDVGAGVSGLDSSVEVYRDGAVETLMGLLLAPFTSKRPPTSATCTAFTISADEPTCTSLPALTSQNYLELASRTYFQHTHIPFYQFYSDFVALYTAVSFAHSLFGALLLPPLAMRYPSDYRRLVWCESGDGATTANNGLGAVTEVIRTVCLDTERVICCGLGWPGWHDPGTLLDVREYLYPVERDGRILGAYTQALLAGRSAPQGFLRLVAVHHVAHTIWPDLRKLVCVPEDEAGNASETTNESGTHSFTATYSPASTFDNPQGLQNNGVKLLRLLLNGGDGPTVRDVLLYCQSPCGPFTWPPSCFDGGLSVTGLAGWREERIEHVRNVIGDDMAERVKVIFQQKGD
ncbi:hypothetical protein ID866_1709 [Astraeus odoratus]|nr:hypothetical protein ID866_1709 [Astraeus odoratus]